MSKKVAAKPREKQAPLRTPQKRDSSIHWKELFLGAVIGVFSLLTMLLIRYQLVELGPNKIILELRNQPQFVFEEVDQEPVVVSKPKTVFKDPKIQECSRLRWLIKSAVLKHNKKSGQMKELKVFELMGESYLKEMPNCPNNGKYQLKYADKAPEISCSYHGKTTK
ncbi:MAG: hypothetical protein KC646_15300 [Candidatus Cloacimonetes bacterium]|nr:hypothetical protein [Candidatus Cloacimonadota bacterium]